MNKISRKQKGFTIVELLIVIVIIGILAAITIVAYNGIQARARDTARTADIKSVQMALELYFADQGKYPAVGSDNVGYNLSTLATSLTPTYIAKIPRDPDTGVMNYQYVRGAESSASYGIRVSYQSKTPCHLGVKNAGIGWWGLGACT